MPRRGDNIHKRKDGRWEGRYKCGIKGDGKAAYRSVYGKSYYECKMKLDKSKSTLLLSNKVYHEHKFSEILDMWIKSNSIRIKGATENKYIYMIETHILPELGNYKISNLTSTMVNSFLDRKIKEGALNGSGGLSPSYVKTIAIIIEAALKFASLEGLCEPNKYIINKPTITKNELEILTNENKTNLEKILFMEHTKIALGTLIALYTGLRIGEICALQWCDVNLNEDVIFVRHTIARVKSSEVNKKTKLILDSPKTPSSKRLIPISSVLKPILQEAYQARKSNFVVSENDTFVSTRTFDYRYRQMLKRYNLDVFPFHIIRHTFATYCIDSGMDVKTLSEILGHSSASTTLNIYVHSSMKMKKKQIEKLYSLA